MEQREIPWPARSVDIRITEQNCKYGCFDRAVAAALRHIADSLDAPGRLASEFEAVTGKVEVPVSFDRVVTIEWAAADVISGPLPGLAEPDHELPPEPAPTAEELASLTPAEREALGAWNVQRMRRGWRAENGQHSLFIAGCIDDRAEAIEAMTDTLRAGEIIGPDEAPIFHFED